MVFPWFSHGFPMVFHGFPMVFPWFSHGFPMVFPWFSHGFPMVFPCFHGKNLHFVPSFTEDPELSSVEVNLNGLGGGGWQRRPAEPGTLWRLENAELVPQGAAVGSVGWGGTETNLDGCVADFLVDFLDRQSLRDDLNLFLIMNICHVDMMI